MKNGKEEKDVKVENNNAIRCIAISPRADEIDRLVQFLSSLPDIRNTAVIVPCGLNIPQISKFIEQLNEQYNFQVVKSRHLDFIRSNTVYLVPNNSNLKIRNEDVRLLEILPSNGINFRIGRAFDYSGNELFNIIDSNSLRESQSISDIALLSLVEINSLKLILTSELGWFIDLADITEQDSQFYNSHLEMGSNAYDGQYELADLVFSNTHDMLCVANFDGYFTLVNPSWNRVLGWSKEELLSRPYRDFIHPDDIPDTGIADTTLQAGNTLSFFENRYLCKDGSYKWLSWNSVPYMNHQLIFGSARDITDLKLAENDLRLLNDKIITLSKVVEQSPISIIICDLNGNMTFVNNACCQISGFSKDELIGHNPRIFKSGLTSSLAYQSLWVNISNGKDWKGIFCNKRRDGELYWEEASISPLFNENGEIVKYISVSQNITERIQIQNSLERNEKRLSMIAETSQTVIWETDKDGFFKYVSPIAKEVWGYDPEELIGSKSIYDLIPEEYTLQYGKSASVLFHSKSAHKAHMNPILHKSGKTIWVESNGIPFFDERGEVLGYCGSDKDITDQLRDKLALENSENRFSQIASHSQTIIWEIDANGMYTYVSPVCLNVWGYLPQELIGKFHYYDLHPEENRNSFKDYTLNLIHNGETIMNFENEIVRKDGHVIWVSTNGVPIFDKSNELIGYRGSDNDITEKKMALDELRKFRIISDQANYGTAIADLQGIILYCNEYFAKMHDMEIEEIVGRNLSENHSADQMERVYGLLDRIVNEDGFSVEEVGRIRKDGTPFTSLMSAKLIRDDANRPMFMSATALDISERKHIEEQNRNLKIAIDQSPVAIVITDLNARIQSISPAFTQITGYTFDEVRGKNIRMLKSGITPKDTIKSLWDTILSGKQWNGELTNRKKDGSLYLESISINPVIDDSGLITSYLAVKQDITQLRQNELDLIDLNANLEAKIDKRTAALERSNMELQLAQREANEANKAKSVFLSKMSHELRTPLNSILGFAQLLELSQLTPTQLKNVKYILKSGVMLLDLINEVLEIARIEAGKISISIETVEITHILTELIDSIQPLADKNRINLTLANQDLSKHYVLADYQRIKQVLLNIMTNGIKYNKMDGNVTVGLSTTDTPYWTQKEGHLIIYVQDTGLGIHPADLNRIFQPFERIHHENYHIEGTGLGLPVSKELITLMHGRIGVVSTPGEGSTFWVEIPISDPNASDQEITLDTGLIISDDNKKINGKIIYIEDNVSNQELVEQILITHRPNIELKKTTTGKQGLIEIFASAPNLVLTDLNLPDMHGSEILRQLQTDPSTSQIPVLVVSADAMPEQIEAVIKMGAKGYLSKPISIASLLHHIDALLS